ncbi:MAG TPA: glycosyltransferase family 2 protein [Anaerolineales bacterium]|nr:glycosyltransferase family 2 protein [Anaerolineales bacterium]
MPPLLSIVILNWNTRDLLVQCLEAVLRLQDEAPGEVIVVDNASTDDSVTMLADRFPQVRVIQNPANVGFAGGNNRGVAACAGKYALMLNTDAFLGPGALRELVRVAESDPRSGVVGAHLLNPDGSFQASHTCFPTLWREFLILSGLGRAAYGSHYPSAGPDEGRGALKVDYVEGASLLVRVEAYRAVNGLDEGFFMYAEEVDLCYTMGKHGWNVWYAPEARVTHLGGASSADRKPEREADLISRPGAVLPQTLRRGRRQCAQGDDLFLHSGESCGAQAGALGERRARGAAGGVVGLSCRAVARSVDCVIAPHFFPIHALAPGNGARTVAAPTAKVQSRATRLAVPVVFS